MANGAMTEVDLREYLEAHLKWLREYMDERFKGSDREVRQASEAVDRALELAREQLKSDLAPLHGLSVRIARLERLIPIVSLMSVIVGAIAAYLVGHFLGVK